MTLTLVKWKKAVIIRGNIEQGETCMNARLETFIDSLFAGLTDNLLPAIVLLVMGILAIRIVVKLVTTTLEKTKLEKAAHSLILSVVRVSAYVLLGLMVATKLGIDVTSIVALASVLTLAVSLALQNMLANVIGGFTILTTQPFHSGDYVEIAGVGGTVQEINMTYTKLTTPDQKLISIPNSSVIASQITNYSACDTRRVEINVSASYDAPVQKVIDALVLAGTEDNVLLNPAPFAAVMSYGDSAINYSLRIWVKNADYWDVYFTVNQKIKKIFDEQGIEMTYPHLNVHLDK